MYGVYHYSVLCFCLIGLQLEVVPDSLGDDGLVLLTTETNPMKRGAHEAKECANGVGTPLRLKEGENWTGIIMLLMWWNGLGDLWGFPFTFLELIIKKFEDWVCCISACFWRTVIICVFTVYTFQWMQKRKTWIVRLTKCVLMLADHLPNWCVIFWL